MNAICKHASVIPSAARNLTLEAKNIERKLRDQSPNERSLTFVRDDRGENAQPEKKVHK
jgi:hypothetical protein